MFRSESACNYLNFWFDLVILVRICTWLRVIENIQKGTFSPFNARFIISRV